MSSGCAPSSFILYQLDNARPHAARRVLTYLDTENIRLLPWLDRSPYWSPIENIYFWSTERLAHHPVRANTCGIDLKQHGMSYLFLSFNSMANGSFVAYPHRPMALHSLTENSLAVLNRKILEANSQVQNVKLGGHQTCLKINRLWHELCDMLRRLVGTTAPGHHDCSIQE
ncbi:uncharacterized protein TNCV_1595921 [Trichonephila clavipes]|nr:uncharacterized protein TNCV_1595921 [Trichonephila clavipes]